jgi:hypothetical protein
VPEITYDGYETTLPIAPAGDRGLDDLVPDYMREEGYYADGQRDNAAHYMRITLGGFDILNVSLEREGNNLTYPTPAGGMVSNGHGILGLLTRQRASIGCPMLREACSRRASPRACLPRHALASGLQISAERRMARQYLQLSADKSGARPAASIGPSCTKPSTQLLCRVVPREAFRWRSIWCCGWRRRSERQWRAIIREAMDVMQR